VARRHEYAAIAGVGGYRSRYQLLKPAGHIVWVCMAASALAGCAGDGIVTRNDVYVKDMRGHLSAAAQSALPVTIRNDPFAGDGAGVAVIAVMSSAQTAMQPQQRFTADAQGSAYRVVVAFGEPPVGGNYCTAPGLAVRPGPQGRTVLHAEFCVGGQILSEATAATGRVDSPQDPRFQRLLSDLLSGLMPQNHPNYNESQESM
jgi:hypothetical protein